MKTFIVDLIHDRQLRIKADSVVRDSSRYAFYTEMGSRVDDVLCNTVSRILSEGNPHFEASAIPLLNPLERKLTGDNHNVFVVGSDEEAHNSLIAQLNASRAHQIVVTGSSAFNAYPRLVQQLQGSRDPAWVFFHPSVPSREEKEKELRRFSEAIRSAPLSRHIFFGPTKARDVIDCLFFAARPETYSCAIYVLGIQDEPFAYISDIFDVFASFPRFSWSITSIYSTSDRRVTGQFMRRLAIAKERGEDVRELTLLYFSFVELCWWSMPPQNGESVDKEFVRMAKATLENEVSPRLFPPDLFPPEKGMLGSSSSSKKWWQIWK